MFCASVVANIDDYNDALLTMTLPFLMIVAMKIISFRTMG
jgi:hypothetical protein